MTPNADQRTTWTAPHKELHTILSDLGFYVEDEVNVGPYWIDCYVRELHMGFEADGIPFHRPGRLKERDAKRDHWIRQEAGIPILRITSDELGTIAKRQRVAQALVAFIDAHSDDIEERRVLARGGGYAL